MSWTNISPKYILHAFTVITEIFHQEKAIESVQDVSNDRDTDDEV